MVVLTVAFVVVALVLAVVIIDVKFRQVALCHRRRALVQIVDGRCEYRATAACADAPDDCERQCTKIRDFAKAA